MEYSFAALISYIYPCFAAISMDQNVLLHSFFEIIQNVLFHGENGTFIVNIHRGVVTMSLKNPGVASRK